MLSIGVVGFICVILAFIVGASFGRSAEQIAVATVLAEEKYADAAVEKFVGRVLRGLKTEYTLVYDEIEADLAYVKRGL